MTAQISPDSGGIVLHRSGPVATLVLDRPMKHNAITATMRRQLVAALDTLASDETTRVVVLTGAGDKAFCAGTDVTEFQGRSGLEQWRRDLEPSRIFEVIERFPKPVIAMIDGYAFGGGCELALACDLRICSDRSQFGQLEVRFGLLPGGGGTQRLTRLVGRGQAMRLILGGDKIDAHEALRIGLIEVLCRAAELEAVVMGTAGRMAEHAPVAIELAKAAINNAEEVSLSAGLRYEASLMGLCMSMGQQEAAIAGFAAKRAPKRTPKRRKA